MNESKELLLNNEKQYSIYMFESIMVRKIRSKMYDTIVIVKECNCYCCSQTTSLVTKYKTQYPIYVENLNTTLFNKIPKN